MHRTMRLSKTSLRLISRGEGRDFILTKYTSWLSLPTFTTGLATQRNLLSKVRHFLPYRFANGTRNTPLSFGLHLGEELFPLGFAPDISHSTFAAVLPNLFFARLPGFPWRPRRITISRPSG